MNCCICFFHCTFKWHDWLFVLSAWISIWSFSVFMLQSMTLFHSSFLWPSNSSLYIWTTSSLCVDLLVDIFVKKQVIYLSQIWGVEIQGQGLNSFGFSWGCRCPSLGGFLAVFVFEITSSRKTDRMPLFSIPPNLSYFLLLYKGFTANERLSLEIPLPQTPHQG